MKPLKYQRAVTQADAKFPDAQEIDDFTALS